MASLESRPLSRACLRLCSSASRPGFGSRAAQRLSADEALQLAALGSPGELRSLAELLDEVNDGDDREEREEAPARRRETRRGSEAPRSHALFCRRKLTFIAALHFYLHF